ncbi:MAG: cyclic nucleotide-binding domain-containing protein [Acidimicrobiia bacterium]
MLIDGAQVEGTNTSRLSLEPGEILMRRGDTADTVFVLVEGSLTVSRTMTADRSLLAIVDEPGAVVGEMAHFGGGVRSVTVSARTRAELIAYPTSAFQQILDANPDLSHHLAELAVQRAEYAELASLLADHFAIDDDEALMSTCQSVQWLKLEQGTVLFKEGDASDAVYVVVRGRLTATRGTAPNEVRIGEAGRGEFVGELGLMGQTPRGATLTAARDTVVARMDEKAFNQLVTSQPRMMFELCLRAVARAEDVARDAPPSTVLALAISPRLDAEAVVKVIKHELDRHGRTYRLWPQRVDALLDTPGIFDSARGEIGGIRVSRLVQDFELETDHLVLELGPEPGPWSRRALGMADRLLVITPDDPTAAEVEHLERLLAGCRPGLDRTVVVMRPSRASPPTGSAKIRDLFSGDQVINVEDGSDQDLARVARVAVGKANALVFGGGGGRGFAHLGVVRAMNELGIPIDIVGGTSIGGVIAATVAEGFTADEATEWARKSFMRVLDYTLPFVSLVKGKRIAGEAENTWRDREIEDLWLTYFCVSTNLTASRIHLHRRGSVVLAIRATTAIPGVMPPVPFEDQLLIDGGVLNNMPIDIAREMSPGGLVIAADVAPPAGPRARHDYGLSVSGWSALRSKLRKKSPGYPRISAVLMRSMITASMRERNRQLASGLADFYLELDISGVSMLDFEDPISVSQRGYEAALPALTQWLEGRGVNPNATH